MTPQFLLPPLTQHVVSYNLIHSSHVQYIYYNVCIVFSCELDTACIFTNHDTWIAYAQKICLTISYAILIKHSNTSYNQVELDVGGLQLMVSYGDKSKNSGGTNNALNLYIQLTLLKQIIIFIFSLILIGAYIHFLLLLMNTNLFYFLK